MADRPTDINDAGEGLYDALAPAFTGEVLDPDWTLLEFCGGLGTLLDPIWLLVYRDDDYGPWSAAFNADDAPEWLLAYVGQFAGVSSRGWSSWSETDKRSALKTPAGFRRGTPEAMEAAVARTLTGTKKVDLLERDTSAYHFAVRTYTPETPDASAAEAAALSQKPAGLVMDFATIDGQTYTALDAGYADYDAVDAAYGDYEAVRTDIP